MVAVPPKVSRLGTVSRYLEQLRDSGAGGRTAGEHHDVAAAAVAGTVAALVESGLVDRVVVTDREGLAYHDAVVNDGGAEAAERAAAAVSSAREVSNMPPDVAQWWLSEVQ